MIQRPILNIRTNDQSGRLVWTGYTDRIPHRFSHPQGLLSWMLAFGWWSDEHYVFTFANGRRV